MKDILEQREERINFLIERGFTGNIETGKVYNKWGKEITSIYNNEYLTVGTSINQKTFSIKQHQFIYYLATGKVVELIDHINGIRTDNRIENLREVTQEGNNRNRKNVKGYSWNKKCEKWIANIHINNKNKHLGCFDDEEDARKAYLKAKELYHII